MILVISDTSVVHSNWNNDELSIDVIYNNTCYHSSSKITPTITSQTNLKTIINNTLSKQPETLLSIKNSDTIEDSVDILFTIIQQNIHITAYQINATRTNTLASTQLIKWLDYSLQQIDSNNQLLLKQSGTIDSLNMQYSSAVDALSEVTLKHEQDKLVFLQTFPKVLNEKKTKITQLLKVVSALQSTNVQSASK